jgi:hypothetical protein
MIISLDCLSSTLEHTSCNATLLEQMINILELKLVSLWEEAVNNGNPASV